MANKIAISFVSFISDIKIVKKVMKNIEILINQLHK